MSGSWSASALKDLWENEPGPNELCARKPYNFRSDVGLSGDTYTGLSVMLYFSCSSIQTRAQREQVPCVSLRWTSCGRRRPPKDCNPSSSNVHTTMKDIKKDDVPLDIPLQNKGNLCKSTSFSFVYCIYIFGKALTCLSYQQLLLFCSFKCVGNSQSIDIQGLEPRSAVSESLQQAVQ